MRRSATREALAEALSESVEDLRSGLGALLVLLSLLMSRGTARVQVGPDPTLNSQLKTRHVLSGTLLECALSAAICVGTWCTDVEGIVGWPSVSSRIVRKCGKKLCVFRVSLRAIE